MYIYVNIYIYIYILCVYIYIYIYDFYMLRGVRSVAKRKEVGGGEMPKRARIRYACKRVL